MHLNKNGKNRWVVVTKRYAFKFPALTSWKNVCFGMINNINEAELSHLPRRCPVLFSLPGGILNVMPRADILSEEQYKSFDSVEFCKHYSIKAEHKPDSYGYLNGEIVVVDYGWL